jgi:hypothetical protein
MFTIQAHGIPPLAAGADGVRLSPAQHRLLAEPKPIRICGAPTGAGKTFAFLQAARQEGQAVIFVVPTQALARDIQAGAERAQVPVCRWDGEQSRELRAAGLEPWLERKRQWDELLQSGGMAVTTPETLSAIVLGSPQFKRIPLDLADLLHASHIVFDEAHTLGVRALGFLHFWAVLAVRRHRSDPERSFKLTLLSATHSNLFQALWNAAAGEESRLPPDAVACFDEEIENGRREDLRMLHGDVEVEIGDGDILACVDRYAAEPLGQGHRLLILYDSLRSLADEEQELCRRLLSLGIQPEECFLINGQDRKAGGKSLGGTGFEAGLCPAEKHRAIVATACIEAGVNIPGLRHAILDPGQDAAALLQRIGRVARGDAAGKVWLTTPDQQRQHWLRLKDLTGTHTIDELRQHLEPLRVLPLDHARRLGSAYWSMLGREQRSLHENLIQAHASLSATQAPGGFLNGLHAALAGATRRGQKHGGVWLERVDRELRDLRGFAPEVSIRFADYPAIEYSRDWASAWLERPDYIDDTDENAVWCYRGPRSDYLRDKPRRATTSLLCPNGDDFTDEFVPGPRSLSDLKRKYLETCRRKAKGHPDQAFLSKACDFIEATGILVRQQTDDNPVI